MVYQDRRDAGRNLTQSIAAYTGLDCAIILGLPRGGVPVAFEVAQTLRLPLDVLVVRKLGVPGQPELAMGAITSDGTVVLNKSILRELRIHDAIVQAVISREQQNAEQQERQYRPGRSPLDLHDSTAVLVDDGLATGATMRAAVRSVKPRAQRIVVAVPVGAVDACGELAHEVDLVICPWTPVPFGAVGQFYRNFQPTTDDEVRILLGETGTIF